MKNWIYVTTADNWEITKRTCILGAPDRNKKTLLRANKGDKCLVYVKQEVVDKQTVEPRIVAEYEIASELFEDNEAIFFTPEHMGRERFSVRLRLNPVTIFKNPIEFKPLIPKLSFIKNKNKWSLTLKGRAMIEIPGRDCKLIKSSNFGAQMHAEENV